MSHLSYLNHHSAARLTNVLRAIHCHGDVWLDSSYKSSDSFYWFAQGLMFSILHSWIHSLHSWRINMDILCPRCFLCCASKDRKWISWLLIGWGEKEVMVWYERNRRAHTHWGKDMLTPCSVNLMVVLCHFSSLAASLSWFYPRFPLSCSETLSLTWIIHDLINQRAKQHS